MANDKKFIAKNGLQAQNIAFVDSINTESNRIDVDMLSSDTLSFSGESGQLFSITDSLTGTIFSVNDISGIPSIEVDDDGTIRFAEFDGNVLIGTATDNGTDLLQINGSASIGANDLQIADEGIDSKIESASGSDLLLNPTSGGNVGIGTTNAVETLDVNGNITVNNQRIYLLGNSSSPNPSFMSSNLLQFNSAGGVTFRNLAGQSGGHLTLESRGSDIILDTARYVGVGTSSPTEMLDVNGNAIISGSVSATSFSGDGSSVTNVNADLLDGFNSSVFQRIISSSQENDLTAGWYTIATNTGNRAIAKFGIRDRDGGDHQSVIFYASHNYGRGNSLTLVHCSHYSGDPFRYIRIKEGGTYDGAMLQVYIDKNDNLVQAYIVGDNFQSSGWSIADWIPDGTDPGGGVNFSSLTNIAAQIDINEVQDGGISTTGPIYAGGNTTQYKVWHAGNDGSGSGLDADLLDGQNGTHYLDYNNFSNTPTIGNGTLTVSGGSGLTGSGTFDANSTTNNTITLNHADTSSQSSSSNSGRTYIQSVTLDTYGHVTGLSTATETVTNTNDIDYVSSVSLNGTSLDFTGVGNAFGGSVDLSSFLDDTNTTYSISAETATGGANLRLTGSNSSTDDVKLNAGSNVSISRDDASTITINSSHPSVSAASSVDNSGVVVIQDVTLDGNGHVTGLGSQDLNDLSTVVFGDGNTASGSNSTAIGSALLGFLGNTASGNYSTAVGVGNTASGGNSSAFGYLNTASESNSTAVGVSNTASGSNSTAVGGGNTASGTGSSAFGILNTASGYSSSAFGYGNDTTGSGSSAVGYRVNVATNDVQEFGKWLFTGGTPPYARQSAIRLHGTGMAALTIEDNATAYTASTATAGAEANGELADGMFAFRRDGTDVYLDGNFGGTIETKQIYNDSEINAVTDSHLSGGTGINYSSGVISHADTSSQASVDNSGVVVIQDVTLDGNGHVTGLGSQDLNDLGTIVFGAGNTASGIFSSAVGFTNTASGNNSSAVGYANEASGFASSAFGYLVNVATNDVSEFGKWDSSSTREGAIRIHDTGMAALTIEDNSTAYSASSAVNGAEANGELADGMFAFRRDGTDVYLDGNFGGTIETKAIGAGGLDAAGLNSLDPIEVGNGNNASGINSSAIGAFNTASEFGSSAFGFGNTASGGSSSAVGVVNTASGGYSSAVGGDNTASEFGSSAVGRSNTASGNSSSAFGHRVNVGTNDVQEFGKWSFSAREGAIRIHNTGMAALTIENNSTAYTASTATAGAEANGELADGMFAFRRDGTDVYLDGNFGGTIETKTIGGGGGGSGGLDAAGLNSLDPIEVGNNNTASGNESSAVGYQNTASGYIGSSAIGYFNTASGSTSSAIGYNNDTSGGSSSAIGRLNTASGNASSAIGYDNSASGDRSSAFGYKVKALTDNVSEFGKWGFQGFFTTVREGAIRLHDTGMAALTIEDNSTAYSASTATEGAEANGELADGMFAFRRDGDDIYIDINIGGTAKSALLATVS